MKYIPQISIHLQHEYISYMYNYHPYLVKRYTNILDKYNGMDWKEYVSYHFSKPNVKLFLDKPNFSMVSLQKGQLYNIKKESIIKIVEDVRETEEMNIKGIKGIKDIIYKNTHLTPTNLYQAGSCIRGNMYTTFLSIEL